MLQKKLMLMIGSMVCLGLLGMFVAYLIFGQIAGDYISLSAIFTPSDKTLESANLSLVALDEIRINIFAGGVAGFLSGLAVPLLAARLKGFEVK